MTKALQTASSSPVLDYYAMATEMTSGGPYAPSLEVLPADVVSLVQAIQGITVYDVVAPRFYGWQMPDGRSEEMHLRLIEKMLACCLHLDDRPLSAVRPVPQRLVGRCRHFTLFLIAMLRAKGIPARARCGFGTYFNPLYCEDHWVCEYWKVDEERWVLVDPQFDDVWREHLRIDHDILDVPRDRFLVAADAWWQCRSGQADPDTFGIHFVDLWGLWFIAGSLIRDMAALNKLEMLPWDAWGAQPRPNAALDQEQLAFFDHLAELTQEPEAHFDQIQKLYATDARLTVPPIVFNSLRNRAERWRD